MIYKLEGFTKKTYGDDSFLVNVVSANVHVDNGNCSVVFNYEIRGLYVRNSNASITYEYHHELKTGYWKRYGLNFSDEMLTFIEEDYQTLIENAFKNYKSRAIIENYKDSLKRQKEIAKAIEAFEKLPEIIKYHENTRNRRTPVR